MQLSCRPKFCSVPSLMIENFQSFFANAKRLSHIFTVFSDFQTKDKKAENQISYPIPSLRDRVGKLISINAKKSTISSEMMLYNNQLRRVFIPLMLDNYFFGFPDSIGIGKLHIINTIRLTR